MADAKISQLPVATTPLAGTELVPIVQSATTKQTTVDAVIAAAAASGTVVASSDIGTAPNEIPLNQYLGTLAYQDSNAVNITGGALNGTVGATTPAAGTFTTLNTTGNTTLGDASTDTVQVNGYMGVGGAPNASIGLNIRSSSLTGSYQHGAVFQPLGTSAATVQINGVTSGASTAASAFTVTDLVQFRAQSNTKGAGSTITNLHGVYIEDQTQGTNNYGITSLVSSGTNKWNIYASGTAANYFAGNVGIGSATITGKFSVASSSNVLMSLGDDSNRGKLRLYRSGATSFVQLWHNGSEGQLLSASPISIDVGADRLRIGTTEAVFNEPGNDYDFRVESNTNTHALFVQGSDGFVGLGTSTPSGRLHVVDSTPTGVALFERTTGSLTGILTASRSLATSSGVMTDGFGPVHTFNIRDTDNVTNIIAGIGAVRDGADNAGALALYTAPSGTIIERLRITSAGYVRLASGTGGIQFNGDTAAANALDDYEEGTFTPTIEGGTTAGAGTYSTQLGRYTKIGNRVLFSLYVEWSAHTGTGAMRLSSFPFTSSSVVSSAVSVTLSNITYSGDPSCLVNSSATYASLYVQATGATNATISIDTSGACWVAGQYFV